MFQPSLLHAALKRQFFFCMYSVLFKGYTNCKSLRAGYNVQSLSFVHKHFSPMTVVANKLGFSLLLCMSSIILKETILN